MLAQKITNRSALLIVLVAIAALSLSCSGPRVDVRTLIPADSLAYFEVKDLEKTLNAITSKPSFNSLAAKKPDLSMLEGIEIGVAVTGFETSETPITEENAVLNFQPRFVAVAETHLWNFQVVGFVEEYLGSFINDVYGGEVTLETSEKHGGRYYTWTSQDGRKAYALTIGSIIFFGNDESAIDKSIAVKNGEADSIAKNAKLNVDLPNKIAFGYVSPDGAAQIANIAGVAIAANSEEESEVKSFIARILPEILRNGLNEIVWVATDGEKGITDTFNIELKPDVAKVFAETLNAGSPRNRALEKFAPADTASISQYTLANSQVAWRSVLLTAQSKLDPAGSQLITAFSQTMFQQYGIADAELFLGSAGEQIVTLKLEQDDDSTAVITKPKLIDTIKASLSKEFDLTKPGETVSGGQIWRGADNEIAVALINGYLLVGDAETVEKCLNAFQNNASFSYEQIPEIERLSSSVLTISRQTGNTEKLVSVLSARKEGASPVKETSFTSTTFEKTGVRRIVFSDHGFLGTIVSQFSSSEN